MLETHKPVRRCKHLDDGIADTAALSQRRFVCGRDAGLLNDGLPTRNISLRRRRRQRRQSASIGSCIRL